MKDEMSNIATNIEQSKHLLELGLDPSTADMWWIDDQLVAKSDKFDVPSNDEETTVHCAWSLDALIEVMRKLNVVVTLQMTEMATWLRIKDLGFIWQKDIHVKDPMDAVYGGMLWLLEKGLIKKGDNDE